MVLKTKILIAYIVILAITFVAYVYSVRLGGTLTETINRLGYILYFARCITILVLFYVIIAFIRGTKTKKDLLTTLAISTGLSIILYFLFF